MLSRVVERQIAWSRRIDAALPDKFTIDGNAHFLRELAWKYIGTGRTIYDVGGGSSPIISPSVKRSRNLRVIGIDIDPGELSKAPAGAYDEVICADICSYLGAGDGDVVICQALLEHVPDIDGAFRALASLLRRGGRAVVFVPSRNALFARLNLLLPERVKKKVLFSIFPGTAEHQGFKSYYQRCTPREFSNLAARFGFDVQELLLFYQSSYFAFFLPLHVLWRTWVLLRYALDPMNAAETFSMVLEKRR